MKDKITNLSLKYISVKNRMPNQNNYYLVILDNDFSFKCVVWYFKDLNLWGKGKTELGELKQEMVTHWLEEKQK